MEKRVFSILVSNQYGVLTKVAGVFGRRGCNIHSLTVCPAEKPDISRITAVAEDDDVTIRQVRDQLSKLEDVLEVSILAEGAYFGRALALIRLAGGASIIVDALAGSDMRIEIKKEGGETIIEAVGPTAQLDALIERLSNNIVSLSRSGATAISIGVID